MVQKVDFAKTKFFTFYEKHELIVSVLTFIAGFLFDVLTLGRIDDLFNLIQQAIYLIVLGTLLLLEIKLYLGALILNQRAQKLWQYHNLVVHFLFGSLLSAYTIFYYTSASNITSFVFILLLTTFMLANEFPQIRKVGLPIRVILFSICILSYFLFVYPIMMGHVGQFPFWLGFLSSCFIVGFILKLNFKDRSDYTKLKSQVLYPVAGVHLFFILGYFFNLIPPVPLAIKKIGIYYEVIKKDGDYIGKHTGLGWKIWHTGSQDFKARADDKVTVLLSIFSPASFKDKIYLKWYFHDDKRGRILEDTIPLTILGGRDKGFRGFATKGNYRPGPWEVVVETSDGRQVGQIELTVSLDNDSSPREFEEDHF